MRYASELEGVVSRGLPPVDKWNPAFSGDIDLTIRRDGKWIYEGSPINRARLVRLFSTVLKREGDAYFLVTPVEKLGITVEDAPFLAVLMLADGDGATQKLTFTTNVGETVTAGEHHPLEFRAQTDSDQKAPYIKVRGGLEALVARAVYYDLVALGERRQIDGNEQFGVWSSGTFFPFGAAQEVFV